MKGASVSKYYRFMGKNNIWVWLQSRALMVNTSNKAMYIVCMNYVLSEEEGEKYLKLEENQPANSHGENTVFTLPNNVHHLQSVCNPGSHIVELDEENHKHAAHLNDELNRSQIPISVNGQSGTDNDIEHRIMVQLPPRGNGYQQTYLMDQSHNCCHQITLCSQQSIPQISENSTVIEARHLSVSSPDNCTVTYTDSLDTRSANIFIASPMDQLKEGYSHDVTTSSNSPSLIDDAGYDSATSPYLPSTYFSPPIVSPACSNDSASTERGYFSDTNSGSRGLIQEQNINFGLGNSSSALCVTNLDLLQGDNSMDDSTTDLSNAEIILDQLLQSFNQQQNQQDYSARNMAVVYSAVETLTPQTPPILCSNAKSTCAKSTFTDVLQTLPAVCKHHINTVSNQNVKKFDQPLLRSFLTMPEDDIPKHLVGFLQSCSNNPSKIVTKDLKSLKKDINAKHIGVIAERCLIQQNSTFNQNGFGNRSLDMASALKPATHPSNNDDSLDFSAMPDDITEFALQYLDNVTDAQTKATMTEFQRDAFMDTSESDLTKDLLGTLKTQNSSSPICNHVKSSDSNLVNGVIKTSYSGDHNCFSTVGKCNKSHSQTLDIKSHSNIPLFLVNGICGCQGISSHDHLYHQSFGQFNEQSKLRSQKVTEYTPINPVKLNGVASSAFCSSEMQTPERSLSILETHLRKGIEPTGKITKEACKSNKPFLQQLLTGELTNDMYIQMEHERFHKDMGVSPQ